MTPGLNAAVAAPLLQAALQPERPEAALQPERPEDSLVAGDLVTVKEGFRVDYMPRSDVDSYLWLGGGDLVLLLHIDGVAAQGQPWQWAYGMVSGSRKKEDKEGEEWENEYELGWFPLRELKKVPSKEAELLITMMRERNENLFDKYRPSIAEAQHMERCWKPPARSRRTTENWLSGADNEVQIPKLPPPGREPRDDNTTINLRKMQAFKGIVACDDLPMADLRPTLLKQVMEKRLVTIDAGTGSGKSTLMPLALAHQCLEQGREARIVVTQPRRVAAKNLARRVAELTETDLGSLIGYRVGRDVKDWRASVVYVTAGHLKEALVHDPNHILSFTHIVLDEVHERSMEADFLMAFLRLLLSRTETISQRVVVMSATLQKTLGNYFKPLLLPMPSFMQPAVLHLPGKTAHNIEDISWDEMLPGGAYQLTFFDVAAYGSLPSTTNELLPSSVKKMNRRRRSDLMQRFCKEMAPYAARIAAHIVQWKQQAVVLVFLPGLEQMNEVNKQLSNLVDEQVVKIYQMHSTLDEEVYRPALQECPQGFCHIVLATNIAESSLTVPGACAVIDMCQHKVSVYDDDIRMSTLAMEWCSKASMMQRRGRTGRTCPGRYIRLMPNKVMHEIDDFDQSAVERAPLVRVALEAAHLAEIIGRQPAVRPALPVLVPENSAGGRTGIVEYYECARNGWVVKEIGAESQRFLFAEADLSLCVEAINAETVLSLLPSPPRQRRVEHALTELRELGAMHGKFPTILGLAALKLSCEVHVARMVVLGWLLGIVEDAVIMAAALSLQSCDVFKSPYSPHDPAQLEERQLWQMSDSVFVREEMDDGQLSEPIMLMNLFKDWLKNGGGCFGRSPPSSLKWGWLVQERQWVTFTEKVVHIADSLARIIPGGEASDLGARLKGLVNATRRQHDFASEPFRWTETEHDRLKALLAWSFAPGGYIGLGQTSALYSSWYGTDGIQDIMDSQEYVQFGKGKDYGPVVIPDFGFEDVQALFEAAGPQRAWQLGTSIAWEDNWAGDALLAFKDKGWLEVMLRLNASYNGKQIRLQLSYDDPAKMMKSVKHVCGLMWQMPRFGRQKLVQVRLPWRSCAYSMSYRPRRGDRHKRSRPKQFLIASGGEYRSGNGERTVELRGVTVLPEGRDKLALMWLLAGGAPYQAEMIALAAPSPEKHWVNNASSVQEPYVDNWRHDWEIRAIRMWGTTLHLKSEETIKRSDMELVNRFRQDLLRIHRQLPHQLSGRWVRQGYEQQLFHIECFNNHEGLVLNVLNSRNWKINLLKDPTKTNRWQVRKGEHSDGHCILEWCETNADNTMLKWDNGGIWIRPPAEVQHNRRDMLDDILSLFSAGSIDQFRGTAVDLLTKTQEPPTKPRRPPTTPGARSRYPGRLVALTTDDRWSCRAEQGSPMFAPWDLGNMQRQMDGVVKTVEEEDYEEVHSEGGDSSQDFSDDDRRVNKVHESNDDEGWLPIATKEDWSCHDLRSIVFVETALALHDDVACSVCGCEELSNFSKAQLARGEHRRCKDCINQTHEASSDPSRCVVCHDILTLENSSKKQRQQTKASDRRCTKCVHITTKCQITGQWVRQAYEAGE
eukprot:TRINITY_DN9788_c0_g2_i1.p1 TRINITY_DN9788_c0_g2~~TRINITY_DN9788_c0_g2_i1.p1  ORF type:complete len:1582 (-),score=344.17 TRINITY_DN9788_c0_g2_i1:185-4930(-)